MSGKEIGVGATIAVTKEQHWQEAAVTASITIVISSVKDR